MTLDKVLDSIRCKDLHELEYSESIMYGDFEIYRYTDDQCIVLMDSEGTEIVQLLYNYDGNEDTSDLVFEVLDEEVFDFYMKYESWI